jgi:hypothetical protein
MRTTRHAFMVRVIVYSRCVPRTPGAAGEGADTGTYRRSRSRASRQGSNAGAQQRTASRSAEDLPIPAVIARIVLRIPIAIDGGRLRAKRFGAEHPKESYPTHHEKDLGVSHHVIPIRAAAALNTAQ